MSTRPFIPPRKRPKPPDIPGGKIAIDASIVAPLLPQRSVWGIVFPIALIVGVVGLIGTLYFSGQRSLAGGFGFFGAFAAIGLIGMLVRGRGGQQRKSASEHYHELRKWFRDLDKKRDDVDAQRRKQWEHQAFFHWSPDQLIGAVGSEHMWGRVPGQDDPRKPGAGFGEVRLGLGTSALEMDIDWPKIADPEEQEPASGHALKNFILTQPEIKDIPKAVFLPKFPGLSFIGDLDEVRGVARAMICQLAAHHRPDHLQIIVVSEHGNDPVWEWVKWLPHVQHPTQRDGCGAVRMVFDSPAALENFLDESDEPRRGQWTKPPVDGPGRGGYQPSPMPFQVIIDDACGTPEEWSGLTGSNGYASRCFIRLAAAVPDQPPASLLDGAASEWWIGFAPDTTFFLSDGELRRVDQSGAARMRGMR
ncbi:hypothetical protein [Mycolicibacterium mageritense]|uniref:hypothetical protein n=1 Tax=Mycolicibacterium mageritense TaxID=53462 RepID=UPI001E5F5427|nr:hypothetical protein [Mycolicibacterium mageritense]